MSTSKLLPLALLYVDGNREIQGATRFQKLAFLAQEETNLGEIFEFQPDKYGPFSPELHATLRELQDRNLIEREVQTNRSGNEKYVYKLTDCGRKVVKQVMEKDSSGQFKQALDSSNEVKRSHNSTPLDRLLRYVYNKYPDYTRESELEEFKPS